MRWKRQEFGAGCSQWRPGGLTKGQGGLPVQAAESGGASVPWIRRQGVRVTRQCCLGHIRISTEMSSEGSLGFRKEIWQGPDLVSWVFMESRSRGLVRWRKE